MKGMIDALRACSRVSCSRMDAQLYSLSLICSIMSVRLPELVCPAALAGVDYGVLKRPVPEVTDVETQLHPGMPALLLREVAAQPALDLRVLQGEQGLAHIYSCQNFLALLAAWARS